MTILHGSLLIGHTLFSIANYNLVNHSRLIKCLIIYLRYHISLSVLNTVLDLLYMFFSVFLFCRFVPTIYVLLFYYEAKVKWCNVTDCVQEKKKRLITAAAHWLIYWLGFNGTFSTHTLYRVFEKYVAVKSGINEKVEKVKCWKYIQ